MSLVQRCGHLFDSASKQQGRRLFEQERVLLHPPQVRKISGEVFSPNESPGHPWFQWDQAEGLPLMADCDCKGYVGKHPCKHLWALMLASDDGGQSRAIPGRGMLSIERFKPLPPPATPSASPTVPTRRTAGAAKAGKSTGLPSTSSTSRSSLASPDSAGHLARPVDRPVGLPPSLRSIDAEEAATGYGSRAAAGAGARTSRGAGAASVAGAGGTGATAGGGTKSAGMPTAPARTLPEYSHRWKQQLKVVRDSVTQTAETAIRTGLQNLAARHEVWFVVDCDASATIKSLVVAMFERFQSTTGAWSPLRPLSVSHHSLHQVTDPEDRALVEMLLGPDSHLLGDLFGGPGDSSTPLARWAPARRSAGSLTKSLYDIALPRLAATGRLVWAENARRDTDFTRQPALHWDSGQPWQYRVKVDTNRTHGVWKMGGELVRPDRVVSLAGTRLMFECGLAIVGDQLARMSLGEMHPWAMVLGNMNSIVIPFEDGPEFLSQLWSFPSGPGFELPKELQWTELDVEPQGRLTIRAVDMHGWRNRLLVSAEFLYDDVVVDRDATQTAAVHPSTKRVFRRRRDLEQKLLDQIDRLDWLEEEFNHFEGQSSHYVIESRRIEELVDLACAAGWVVVADGRVLRRGGAVRLSVSSGIDWFELKGTADFGGVTVSLPVLLAAIRRGEKYVRLDDGTQGMVPREWLERFGRLASLGERDGDVLRFQMSQTMLLDALLAAQDESLVSADERFEQVRNRLRQSSGAKPLAPPEGFQGTLRRYQQEGLGWLNFLQDIRCGGCLADDMGLGKTVQVLSLLEQRRRRPLGAGEERRPSLVVVPRSLVFNWVEEAKRFTPELRVFNFTGSERESARDRLHEYDVIVTTYGTLRRDVTELQDVKFDYAILDEAQAIKNHTSQSAKACRLIQADHRLAMTGTPIENHLGELWSLFEFLNPGMLGQSRSFQALAKSTGKKSAGLSGVGVAAAGASSGDASHGNSAGGAAGEVDTHSILAQALRPFILRRTKQQVLTELPERTEQTLYCEMEAEQRKLYDELKEYYRKSLADIVSTEGLAKSKIHVLEALLRLRQAACHPALISEEKATIPSAKMDALLEQLEELLSENHKALVFSQFTSLLAIVRTELDKRGLKYEYLDGQTVNRQACVQRFQSDAECRLFLISLKAGGHGLNLTAADYVFILDPWWNPAVEAQAVDRAYRMGQTRHVFAYRLICRDTVEEKIMELQRGKRELADAIISEDNAVLRDLTSDDLNLLFS